MYIKPVELSKSLPTRTASMPYRGRDPKVHEYKLHLTVKYYIKTDDARDNSVVLKLVATASSVCTDTVYIKSRSRTASFDCCRLYVNALIMVVDSRVSTV